MKPERKDYPEGPNGQYEYELALKAWRAANGDRTPATINPMNARAVSDNARKEHEAQQAAAKKGAGELSHGSQDRTVWGTASGGKNDAGKSKQNMQPDYEDGSFDNRQTQQVSQNPAAQGKRNTPEGEAAHEARVMNPDNAVYVSGPKPGEDRPAFYDPTRDDYSSDGGENWGADGQDFVALWGEDFREDYNHAMQQAYDAGDERAFNDLKYAARLARERDAQAVVSENRKDKGAAPKTAMLDVDEPAADTVEADGRKGGGRPDQARAGGKPITVVRPIEKDMRHGSMPGAPLTPVRGIKSDKRPGHSFENVLSESQEDQEAALEDYRKAKLRTSKRRI